MSSLCTMRSRFTSARLSGRYCEELVEVDPGPNIGLLLGLLESEIETDGHKQCICGNMERKEKLYSTSLSTIIMIKCILTGSLDYLPFV